MCSTDFIEDPTVPPQVTEWPRVYEQGFQNVEVPEVISDPFYIM